MRVDRTRQITYTLTNGGGDDPAALAEAKRDADFVGNTGAQEDRAVVQAIQRGLGSRANDAFTFGHYESAIVHFHKTLTAALVLVIGSAGVHDGSSITAGSEARHSSP